MARAGLGRAVVRPARVALALRALPPRVALFYARALRRAHIEGDRWGPDAAARPAELAALLMLARGCQRVVELGTAMGWTAIALALDDPGRRVTTIDPLAPAGERQRYLDLVSATVRARIRFVRGEGAALGAQGREAIDLLFIDSSHDRAATGAEFRAWRPRLAPGGIVAFHDFEHPEYPGVAEAVVDLGLTGEVRGGTFIWRAPDGEARDSSRTRPTNGW